MSLEHFFFMLRAYWSTKVYYLIEINGVFTFLQIMNSPRLPQNPAVVPNQHAVYLKNCAAGLQKACGLVKFESSYNDNIENNK